jgi:hypothetical protein
MTATPHRLSFALRAFPRRFRTARSAEIVATFREAELAGDDHPYGWRALVDVVRAGWSERLRTHPPLGHFLKYRLFDGRLDPQWHRWMFDDVRGWYGLRQAAWTLVPLLVLAVGLRVGGLGIPDTGFVVMYTAATIVFSALFTPKHRRRTLRRHGYDPETLTWAPPITWPSTTQRPPRQTSVTPLAFTLAAALAVVAPFAVLASLGLIGAGADSFTRHANRQVSVTIGAVAIAVAIAVATVVGRRRFARRFTQEVDDTADLDLVVSDLPSAGALSTAVAAIGVTACAWPGTPSIVPASFIVVVGVLPALVIAGADAHRRGRHGVAVVWTRRPMSTEVLARTGDAERFHR